MLDLVNEVKILNKNLECICGVPSGESQNKVNKLVTERYEREEALRSLDNSTTVPLWLKD